jgi:hypothetical protein
MSIGKKTLFTLRPKHRQKVDRKRRRVGGMGKQGEEV